MLFALWRYSIIRGIREINPNRHVQQPRLDLHLGQTVLPDGDEWGDTVLAVVEEDDHAVGVHALASVKLVVLEVGDDLLSKALGLALEVLDLGLVSTLCL